MVYFPSSPISLSIITIRCNNLSNFLQAFGTAAEALEHFLARGVINWGAPVTSLLEDGQLYIQQARATEASGKQTFLTVFKQCLTVITTIPIQLPIKSFVQQICVKLYYFFPVVKNVALLKQFLKNTIMVKIL